MFFGLVNASITEFYIDGRLACLSNEKYFDLLGYKGDGFFFGTIKDVCATKFENDKLNSVADYYNIQSLKSIPTMFLLDAGRGRILWNKTEWDYNNNGVGS